MVDTRDRMFGVQAHSRTGGEQQWEDFLAFKVAVSQ